MSVFLFPGQGSQTPGMGADFYENSPTARAVFDAAAEQVGRDLLDVMFEGPADALTDTRRAQPALVLCGIAIAAHLAARNIRPTACAGHSVGEIAALAVAGALSTQDALAITRERARLMAETAAPGAMAAVLGLAPDAIAAALPAGVEVANYNGPQQTIIAGPHEALEAAADPLKAAGAKRVLPLRVSGPFHSSYMQPSADAFREVVAEVQVTPPQVRFVSSVSGKEESDPERIRELLWRQLAAPVRWTEVMAAFAREAALEIGPGTALQGIAKRTDNAPVISPAGTLPQANSVSLL